MNLYHFTCDHSLDGIAQLGHTLRPWGTPGLPQLVWLTDLDVPDREGLGLTSRTLDCDRTRWRYTTDEPFERVNSVLPWLEARRSFRPTYVEALERARGAQPDHWYISRTYVPVGEPEQVTA